MYFLQDAGTAEFKRGKDKRKRKRRRDAGRKKSGGEIQDDLKRSQAFRNRVSPLSSAAREVRGFILLPGKIKRQWGI